MKATRVHITIHVFALMHALTAFACRMASVPDEYLLTMLTITMIVILCAQRETRLVIGSCAVVFGNLAGYLLGEAIAEMMGLVNMPHLMAFSVSTFLTTELLGFLILGVTGLFEKSSRDASSREVIWMVATCAVIYVARVILSVCQAHGLLSHLSDSEGTLYFLLSFCTMTVLLSIAMIGYEVSERARVNKEKEKRHLAQFRYMKLNQQVNPHFLFNSLNVLDCLVVDGETEKASTYIHKLSNLYRYMLSSEDEVLVKLRDEMDFVGQYIDLMQVRFPEGLEFTNGITEDLLNSEVVPCSVQLLIENATKHNAIRKDNSLHIRVYSPASGYIAVSNNLCPKLTPVNSTGKGLKYIRQQYKDISGKDIVIDRTDSDYTVTLPLL